MVVIVVVGKSILLDEEAAVLVCNELVSQSLMFGQLCLQLQRNPQWPRLFVTSGLSQRTKS